MNPFEEAREVLREEIRAIQTTLEGLDERFDRAMSLLRDRKGKIVVTGVGKSGLIGRKIAATMSSMGIQAVFMHAGDAAHGDLGLVAPDDVALILSHSGETEEALALAPAIRRIGANIVALVGDDGSRLAKLADAVICVAVPKEADHLNLAPTASAVTALAVGDAITALLSKWRGFGSDDFAMYHPGGQLGRRLLLDVRSLMRELGPEHVLLPSNDFRAVLNALTANVEGAGPLGAALIVQNREGRELVGLITDGDLRRAILQHSDKAFSLRAEEFMTRQPMTIDPDERAESALRLMEDRPRQITVLPVVGDHNRLLGLLRLHDLLQIGFHAGKSES